MKRGSRNLLEARTKRNQEQEKLETPKKQRFTRFRRTISLQTRVCLKPMSYLSRRSPLRCVQSMAHNVICLDPSPRTLMKTLHHTFRTWIWWTMFRVRTHDMTTCGHNDATLTLSPGTRAQGSENSTSQNAKLINSTKKEEE